MMTDYEKKTDEELIMDFRGGDTAIMDYLLEKYKPMVKKKAKAMYLLGGDSDDLIQEGMIGLFKAVRDYDSAQEASFGTFAQICVTRQLYSAIRASRRKKHLPLNSYISLYDNEEISEEKESELIQIQNIASTNNPEDLVIHKESEDSFMNELEGNLSELERKVLYLHLLGTDYRTIAKLLGKSPKAVDNALQRIKTKAEELLTSI
ncbi:RNA polymerase sporulation sigma factor SigH [Sellimonas intestinalis]